MAAKLLGKVRLQKSFRGFQQRIGIRRFRTEADIVAQPGKDRHSACCKAFRGSDGVIDRQLDHKIRAAGNSRLRPLHFIKDGRVSSLDKIAAHDAHDRVSQLAQEVYLLLVTTVQGIIFTDNAGNFQNKSHLFGKICKTGVEKFVIVSYNTFVMDIVPQICKK